MPTNEQPAYGWLTLLRVFIPFSLGYYFSYLIRNVNAIIAPDLISDLGLDASSLGLLTSAYFISFALVQLPMGIFLDRYGPRRVEATLLLFAATGSLIFSLSESLPSLIFGRTLIGLGVASCLMAAFKANTEWFRAERLPLANGCVLAMGGLGAMTATAPIEALLGYTDWRGVFAGFALLALFISGVIYIVVPRRGERNIQVESFREQLMGVRHVLSSRQFWRVAPACAAVQAGYLAVQGLWVGPWLQDVAKLSRVDIAEHLFVLAISVIAGFFVLGSVTERFGRRGVSNLTVAQGSLYLFLASQFMIILQVPLAPMLLWCMFGFFGTAGILFYAYLSQCFPATLSGRVITGLNVFTFLGAFAMQWGIGAIIDLWPAQQPGQFLEAGYQSAFSVSLAIQVVAMIWLGIAHRGAHRWAPREK